MKEQANNLWRSHVNHLTARILEESGYKTNQDFMPLKIKELLSNASISYYDVENLLCGLYKEANRWREKIGHKPNFLISDEELEQKVHTICDNAGFLEHPEWLAEITVGDFLELEGLDEVTIPDVLEACDDVIQDAIDSRRKDMPSVSYPVDYDEDMQESAADYSDNWMDW